MKRLVVLAMSALVQGMVNCAAAHAAAPEIPPQDPKRVAEIAATLRPEAGFAETRVGNRAAWEKVVAADPKSAKALIARGEAVLAQPMTAFDDAEYFTVDPKSGDVGVWYTKEMALNGQLQDLVFAECLEGKGRFVKRIADTLDRFAGLRTWVIPYHDRTGRSFKGEIRKIELIGGIMTESIARTVDLLRDVLPPDTVTRAKKAVWDKELEVYVGIARDVKVAQQNDCSWLWSIYNWNAACNFYMVSTAVYVLDDPKLRAECIELAERSVPIYLSGFTRDGLSLEGPSYWDYGFGSYLTLALQVRRASGGKVPFVTDFSEKVMASGFDNRYNDLNAPGYGDSSSNELMGPPSSTWFRGSLVWPRFACPLANRRGLQSGLFMTTLTDFASVGLPQGVSYATPYRYPLRTWYADGAQQLVCRPVSGQTNALYAAIKGGDNGVGHNHNDVGTYTVAVDGYELVCDPGCKAYDQDTFTAKRYEENTRNSYGHPVPYVDGTMQSAGAQFAARVMGTSFADDRDEVKLDLKGAYACDKVDRLVRRFTYWRDRGQLVVTDDVKLKSPGAFESPIITFGTVTPKGDGLYEIVYKGGHCRVMCRVEATGGTLVTKSEELSFIGRKGDPRARGVPTRFAFAFAEPVTEATITFTYWIPRGDESSSAAAAASARPAFVNDIALPSCLYMLRGVRNEVFVQPFLKRWRPYDDFVRFETRGGRNAFLRRLGAVATVTNPVDGAKLDVTLVHGDAFETVKKLSPTLRVGEPAVGTGDVYAQIVGDSLTHGGFYKNALFRPEYVPNLHLVGLRRSPRAKGLPAQYHEGRGGWQLKTYFKVPKGEHFSYHGFMQPKDGRYWGDTSFWKMAWRVCRGTQPKGFEPTYSCEEFGEAAERFDEQTGFLMDPQTGDCQFDAERKQMVRWDGAAWRPVDEQTLEFGFDYGKYLAMWKIPAPKFLFVYLGCNDFSGAGFKVDYEPWAEMLETFKRSYESAVPGGKFVLGIENSTLGSDDNRAGMFNTKMNAVMWQFRDWLIRRFDQREAEGWYLLDGGLAIDNEHGFYLEKETAPNTLPYAGYASTERLRVQWGNPHAYPNYPAMGVPFAAFIQYWRDR